MKIRQAGSWVIYITLYNILKTCIKTIKTHQSVYTVAALNNPNVPMVGFKYRGQGDEPESLS